MSLALAMHEVACNFLAVANAQPAADLPTTPLTCAPLQDKQTVDPNRVGGPTNALLGENALTTTIGAAGGLANDAASNALRRMAAR